MVLSVTGVGDKDQRRPVDRILLGGTRRRGSAGGFDKFCAAMSPLFFMKSRTWANAGSFVLV